MRKPITQDRMEEALQYLCDTDEAVAIARAEQEREDYRAEAVKDAVFLRMEGSVAERTAIAKTHPEYVAAKEKYFTALQKFETLRNRRSTESVVIEAWRSLNAAMRQR